MSGWARIPYVMCCIVLLNVLLERRYINSGELFLPNDPKVLVPQKALAS